MFSRILLGAVSMAVGAMLTSALAAAGSGSDVSATAAASAPSPELTVAPPTDYPDVRLLSGYVTNGQFAVNPADPRRLVVGIGFPGDYKCYVKRSADGGKTWGALVPLPRAAGSGTSYCAGPPPAVTYSADGSRLYAAYTYLKPVSSSLTFAVAVGVSLDEGATWSAKSAFSVGSVSDDWGFVDLRLVAQPDGSRLYMVENFRGVHGRFVYFASSPDQGLSWAPIKLIAVAFPDEGTDLHDVALAAGRRGNVLIAYGWSEVSSSFDFTLQVARSADYGASFLYGTAERYSSSVDDGSLELSQPDIKIGQLGTAHLVYDKGSNAILYKYSLPPYNTWSAAPARLDDEISAAELSEPRLAVGACGQASVLHATWVQNRTGTGNILYTRKVAQTGSAWSDPLKVGKSNYRLGGNELAGVGAKAFSIWQASVPPGNSTMFGSRVWSGVTCP